MQEIKREIYGGVASVDGRRIQGRAVVFNSPSDVLWYENGLPVREVIDAGAIQRSLLDESDIKMTLYHDRHRLLARSKNGTGTLSYEVSPTGVSFSFDAPATVCGDEALELVKRGDLSGCSFAFVTYYDSPEWVKRETGKDEITYRVMRVKSVHDFTLTDSPAYPETDVTALRDLVTARCDVEQKQEQSQEQEPPQQQAGAEQAAQMREQVRRMRTCL